MPRSIDPGSLTSGSGLAAAESVDVNALINPIDDTVRVHIIDPSRAHQARAIHVVDSAGLFVSDHVEGALSELAGGTAAFSSNGLISGGTYTVAAGVLTLDAGTTALINGNAIDFSGFTVALPPTVTDQWLIINKNTALLQVVAAPPALADEHIPLWRITTDGIPAITAFTDARYFVFNVDRKLPYTVRNSGSDDNRHSDANFESMSAAFLWLATYWPTNEAERAILIVRGQETITSTLLAPITNLVIEGEGGGQLNAGAVLSPMLDLNGKSKVTIKNLSLVCDAAGATSTAIGNTGAPVSSPQVINCDILSGGGNWNYGVWFTGSSVARAVLQHCQIQAVLEGYHNDLPDDDRVVDCLVHNPSGTPASSVGISIGDPGVAAVLTQGKALVKDCTLEGFDTGIFLKGAFCTARDNRMRDPNNGLLVDGLSCMARDNYIIMTGPTAFNGVELLSGSGHKVTGNVMTNSRTTGHGGIPPHGILVTGTSDCFLDGNHIDGFFSDSGASYGIFVAAPATNTTINGGYINAPSTGIHLDGGSSVALVTGVRLLNNVTGFNLGGTSGAVQGCVVNLNSTTGETGCVVSGSDCKLVGTHVESTRVWPGPTGITPRGIQLTGGAVNFTASDCTLKGFHNTTDLLGAAVDIGAGSNRLSILNTLMDSCYQGVRASEVAHDHLSVSKCTFQGTLYPVSLVDTTGLQTHSVKILGNTIEGSAPSPIVLKGYRDFEVDENTIDGGAGLVGNAITITGVDSPEQRVRRFSVSGNNIRACGISGIRLLGYVQNGTVANNQIDNLVSASTQVTGAGIQVEQVAGVAPQYLTINGNTIWNSTDGIILSGATGTGVISRCTMEGNIIHHIADDVVPADTFAGAGGKALGLEFVSDTTISDNQIHSMGQMINTTDTLFPPAGPNYSAQGIYCLNCQGLSILGNNIRRVDPGGTGVAYGIAIRQRGMGAPATNQVFNVTGNTVWDSSTAMDSLILVNPADTLTLGQQALEGVTIEGNNLRGGAQSVLIDMGADSLITSLSITGNTVTGPVGSGIVANVGGGGLGSSLVNTVVSNNTLNNVGSIGIDLFATYLGGGVGPANISNCNVSGNTIEQTGAGSAIRVGSGSATSAIDGLRVSENSLLQTGAHGIFLPILSGGSITGVVLSGNTVNLTSLAGISAINSASGIYADIQVDGNVIKGAGTNGIVFSVNTGALTNVAVNGNTVTSPGVGGGGASQGMGVAFLAGNGPMTNVQVDGNIIADAGTMGIALGGQELLVQATATITLATVLAGNSVTIDGITLTAVTGAPGLLQFERVASDTTTAQNLVAAINNVANGLTGTVSATNTGNVVTITAVALGAAGNGIVLSENTTATSIVVTTPTAGGVGGVGDASSMLNFQVCGNTIQAPAEAGILVLTYDGTIRGFTVSDNEINRPGQLGGGIASTRGGGILFSAVEIASTVVFSQINMTGNRVTWDLGDTGANFSYGIGLLGYECDIQDVSISDCQVVNSPASGIYVGTIATAGGRLDSIAYKDCTVRCQATAANAATYPHYGAAMVMAASAPGAPHSSLSIQGCNLQSDSIRPISAAATILAFPFGGSDGGKFQSLTFSDNVMTNSYNGFLWSTLVGAGGIYTGFAPVMENIIISRNIARVCAGYGIASPMLADSLGGSVDHRIENVQITDNSCFKCATSTGLNMVLAVEWPLPCINIQVSRNQIYESGNVTTPAGAATTAAISLTMGALGGANVGLQNVSVLDNEVFEIIGSGLVLGTSLAANAAAQATSVRNIKVNGNAIRNVTESGLAVLFPLNSNSLLNIEVNDNSVNLASGNAGTGIGHGVWVSMTDYTVENLSVCRNQVRQVQDDGINVNLSGLAGVLQADVSGNSVRNTLAGQGVSVFGPSTGASNSVKVNDNQVYSAASQGMLVDFADVVANLQVDGNQVDTPGGRGVDINLEEAHVVQVNKNGVNGCIGDGIYVENTFSSQQITLHGNIVRLATLDSIVYHVTTGNTIESLVISGNSVVSGSTGISVEMPLAGASKFVGLVVDGNSIHSPATHGIFFKGFAGVSTNTWAQALQENTVLQSATFNNNTVFGPTQCGILVQSTSGAMDGVTVSNNQIWDWNTDNSVGIAPNQRTGILFGATDGGMRNISVVGNSLVSRFGGAVGIGFYSAAIAPPQMDWWNISITGNNIAMDPTVASTFAFLLASSTSSDQRQWTIVGNNVRGARKFYADGTGGSPVPGSFAAARSFVYANTGRGGDGTNFVAGNWSGLLAALFPAATTNTLPNQE